MRLVRMQALAAAFAAAAVTVASSAGCSGDDEVTADGFIEQYSTAFCEYTYRCCDGSERSYGSQAQCEQRLTERLERLLAFTDEADPGARFVASAASSCLERIAGDCPAATKAAGECIDQVVKPLRTVGDDCLHDAECDAFYCVISQGQPSGACVSESTPGGGCGGDDRGCPEGYFCSTAKVCTALKEPGDLCTGPNECASGICNPAEKICGGMPESLCDGRQ